MSRFAHREALIGLGSGVVAGLGVAWSERRRSRSDRLDLAQVAAEQAALQDIAVLVARGASVDSICDVVAGAAVQLFDAHVALVARLVGEDGLLVRGLASNHPLGRGPRVGDRLAVRPGGAVAEVLSTGQTARVGDSPVSLFDGCLGEHVAAPIPLSHGLWGVLAVGACSRHTFSPGVSAQLERFAGLVALAIGNADAHAQLVREATRDPLTALANTRTFTARVREEIAKAHRHDQPLCLALIDIDHFKQINDSRGHLVGDDVLRELAERLQVCLRTEDLLARIGGDEFAVVLSQTVLAEAEQLLCRLCQTVSSQTIGDVTITVSAGVAQLDGFEDDADLRRRADRALYAVKATGRDGVQVAPSLKV